jgi:hypothetical protein
VVVARTEPIALPVTLLVIVGVTNATNLSEKLLIFDL